MLPGQGLLRNHAEKQVPMAPKSSASEEWWSWMGKLSVPRCLQGPFGKDSDAAQRSRVVCPRRRGTTRAGSMLPATLLSPWYVLSKLLRSGKNTPGVQLIANHLHWCQ